MHKHVRHKHSPHLYVVYWPAVSVLKIGISTKARWSPWRSRGGVEVAAGDLCCMPWAYRIEQYLHRVMRTYGSPAFADPQSAKPYLGGTGAGYSECVVLPRSPLYGQEPRTPYDYERAWGLVMPQELREELDRYDVGWAAVDD